MVRRHRSLLRFESDPRRWKTLSGTMWPKSDRDRRSRRGRTARSPPGFGYL